MGADSPSSPTKGQGGRFIKRLLAEGLIVGLTGALLAFAANTVSPRRIQLTRIYFPKPSQPVATAPAATNAASGGPNQATNSPMELLSARLRQEGFGLADSNQVTRLFHDPRFNQEQVVFVDARNDEHYKAGHVPGAFQFDYYNPGPYLSNVLQVCMFAEQIVVYCNGGNCDDSIFTATFLRDAGVPREKLFVYGGGFSEWRTNGLPIELGERRSGQMLEVKPPQSHP